MKSQICTLIFVFSISLGCNTSAEEKRTGSDTPTVSKAPGAKQVITAAQLSEILRSSTGQQLIDVRTPEEFAAGHIEGARNLNIYDDDFSSRIAELDRDKPVYLYCKSGKRSAKAAEALKKLDFPEIYELKGGYKAWPAQVSRE